MRTLLAALTFLGLTAPALSQTMISGSITMIRTGWNAESFAIVTAEPINNPAGCAAPDGYISDSFQPGYNTYLAAALTAYAANRSVQVTVHNTECGFAGRPKLIGINILR